MQEEIRFVSINYKFRHKNHERSDDFQIYIFNFNFNGIKPV